MSERFYPDSIGPMQPFRLSEDLSLLHAHELRRLFGPETAASLGLIERPVEAPREAESFRPIAAPVPIETTEKASIESEPILPHTRTATKPVDPERAPRAEPVREAEVPRRDWLLEPEPMVAATEPQPFGDDPARIRDLIQWFADGRAASAMVQAPKAAGDLVQGAAVSVDPYRLRPVAAGGRAG